MSDINHFQDMSGLIYKLENKIYTEQTHQRTVIHVDKNEKLKGLEHINGLYQAVLEKKVLKIEYQSFKARRSRPMYYFPYLLKEFNNRWFLIGKKQTEKNILTLALDRIHSFSVVDHIPFIDMPEFNPDEY